MDKTSCNLSRFPKFLVIHSESDKELSKMSPFLVAKVLESLIGKSYKAKKMTSGDLLVSVTPHRTLNTIRGVISEEDLLETTDDEIVEGLSDQGVVAARRICLRRDGQELTTKHILSKRKSGLLVLPSVATSLRLTDILPRKRSQRIL
ncbi:unnamed protein product, partial [Ixodes hexagonus]